MSKEKKLNGTEIAGIGLGIAYLIRAGVWTYRYLEQPDVQEKIQNWCDEMKYDSLRFQTGWTIVND